MSTNEHTTSDVEYRGTPELEGYRFGSDGSVWSRWKRAGRWVLSDEWHQVKVSITIRRGRPHLPLFCRKGKSFAVGRIILELFVGPCPPGMECRRINGDPSNNRLDNLAWGTHQQNMDDMVGHGTSPCGERSGRARFTESDIKEIRSRRDNGESTYSLAKAFKTRSGNICRIVQRVAWKHVP